MTKKHILPFQENTNNGEKNTAVLKGGENQQVMAVETTR